MAFPSIQDQVSTSRESAETTSPIALPTPAASGDLLLVVIRAAAAGAIGWPAGWTELFEDSSDGSDDVTAAAWRKADGSEAATIDVTHGSATAVAFAYRISGASDPALQAPEASAAATGSSSAPDSPELTPSGGAKDTLWLSVVGHEGASGITSGGYPSDFPDHRAGRSSGGSAAGRAFLYTAALQANAAAWNPGAYALTLPVLWSAWTIAIPPSEALLAPLAGLDLDAPDAVLVLGTQILAAVPAELELAAPQPASLGGPRHSTGQLELSAASAQAPVVLVHLTTWSDHEAETVEAEYFFTWGQDLLYRWNGGAVRSFEGALLELSDVSLEMEHLPKANVLDTRRTGLDLVLGNDALAAGGTRWSELRTRNLAFARVELAVLLVPTARRAAGGTQAWDLRDLPGNEHVFWFRGECTQVGPVTATRIPLSFEAIEPTLDWPLCTEASECDPRHLGSRYAVPIGKAKSVTVRNRIVGWVTTLAEEIATDTFTGQRKVTDASGLPDAGSFTLQIGAERVTASKVNPTTIQITARGQAGTIRLAHKASEQVIEVPSSSVFVFSGIAAKALDALYALSPLTGEHVRILTPFSVNLANTALDSGRTLGTITFTAAQFQAMIDSMLAVSQQPTLLSGGVSDSIPLQTHTVESSFPESNNVDAILESAPTRLTMRPVPGADEGWKVYFTSSAGMPNPTAQVTRFRLKLNVSGIGGPGGFPNANATILRYKLTNIYGRTQTGTAYIFDNGITESGVTFDSGWLTPGTGGPFLENAIVDGSGNTRHLRFWIEEGFAGSGGFWDNTHNEAKLNLDSCELEVELEPATLTDLGIAAVSLGWGLDFVADVQGAQTAGVLHESPPDVVSWFLREFAGLGSGAIDAESFALAETNLAGLVLAGDLSLVGDSFAAVLAALAFHSRANLVAREEAAGTRYRMLAATAGNAFPAPVRTLAELRDQSESRRAAGEQATRFLAHLAFRSDASGEDLRAEDARELVRIDADRNDATAKVATAALVAAEARWGRRDAEAILFPLIQDLATAIDVLGYYAFESIAVRGRFAETVPYAEAYDLELGDSVSLVPQGHASAVKGRIVQLSLAPGEPHVGLIAEEVT